MNKRRLPVREGAITLGYIIALISTALIVLTPGCLGYFIGPIIAGWLLAAFVLPLFSITITWWQAALGVFVLRFVVKIIFKK